MVIQQIARADAENFLKPMLGPQAQDPGLFSNVLACVDHFKIQRRHRGLIPLQRRAQHHALGNLLIIAVGPVHTRIHVLHARAENHLRTVFRQFPAIPHPHIQPHALVIAMVHEHAAEKEFQTRAQNQVVILGQRYAAGQIHQVRIYLRGCRIVHVLPGQTRPGAAG